MKRQYVGIDLHRRRSAIVRMDHDGEKLFTAKIENTRWPSAWPCRAGPGPEVALEASYKW